MAILCPKCDTLIICRDQLGVEVQPCIEVWPYDIAQPWGPNNPYLSPAPFGSVGGGSAADYVPDYCTL